MYVIPIPCSFDNYSYLLVCEKTGEAAVIDPTEAYPVMGQVEAEKVKLSAVLCTHHHNDHIGDIGELLKTFPDLNIYCHRADQKNIANANCFVEDGDSIKVGELEGEIIHTPGHTFGSICYHFGDVVFTGDTLFGAGCGRLFEGTAKQMYDSLNLRLATLPDDTKLFFGHEYTKKNLEFSLNVEPQNDLAAKRMKTLQEINKVSTPTTLKLEKETNPFLRSDSEDIRNNLGLRGLKPEGAVEVFAAVRHLRNPF